MEELVLLLRAMADENRFRIMKLLLTHDLCVGALASRVGITKAAVSQHLQILRRAGLVRGEKRSYWTHYSVQRKILKKIAGGLSEMSDQGRIFEGICPKNLPMAAAVINERRGEDMCKDCCQQQEKLKKEPEKCTPEQIKMCHGDTEEHPCEIKKK